MVLNSWLGLVKLENCTEMRQVKVWQLRLLHTNIQLETRVNLNDRRFTQLTQSISPKCAQHFWTHLALLLLESWVQSSTTWPQVVTAHGTFCRTRELHRSTRQTDGISSTVRATLVGRTSSSVGMVNTESLAIAGDTSGITVPVPWMSSTDKGQKESRRQTITVENAIRSQKSTEVLIFGAKRKLEQ